MNLFGIRRSFASNHFIVKGGYFEILKIAYPLIIMSATHALMMFTDRAFLARNSTLDLAASMPAGILYFTLFSFFQGTCNYTAAIVAQYFGANDKSKILNAVWAGQAISIIAGLFITYLVSFIGESILLSGGHEQEILTREIKYFSSLLPSGVFVCMAAPYYAYFSGQGRTIPVAVVNVIGCIINMVLDYLLIFGYGAIPKLGIFGAGLASSISCLGSFLIIAGFFYCQNQKNIPTRSWPKLDFSIMGKIFRYGAPAGFQILCDAGAFTLVTFMIGQIGKSALAASVIALSINNIFFVPLLGISDATAILTGQYIGKNRKNNAESIGYRAWRLSAIYMTIGAIVYLVFPHIIIELFSPIERGKDFESIVEIGVMILAIAVVINAADTVKFIFMGALRGTGDTFMVFIINSCNSWFLLVPGTIYLTKIHPIGINGLWAFIALVVFIDSMVILWRFQSGTWRKINLIGKK